YAATFGRWLGVGEGDLTAVAPNLGNFASRDLGLFDPESIPEPPPTTTTPPTTVPTTGPSTTDEDHCPPVLDLSSSTTTGS
ncbi:MAG: hypothetical protein AAFO29_22625, partial [Actinomycetota bacterium]